MLCPETMRGSLSIRCSYPSSTILFVYSGSRCVNSVLLLSIVVCRCLCCIFSVGPLVEVRLCACVLKIHVLPRL